MPVWVTNHTGIAIVILILGLGLIALGAWLFERKRRHEWARAARHLHLKFSQNDAGPTVKGKLQGRLVELQVSPESSDSGGGVVVARASARVTGNPASMTAEAIPGVIASIAHLAEDRFLTGDPDFDNNVNLQGPDEQQLRAYWTAQRRRAFLELAREQNYDRLALEQDQLCIEIRGVTSDHRQVESLLQRLVHTSQKLDNPAPTQP